MALLLQNERYPRNLNTLSKYELSGDKVKSAPC